MSREGIIKLWEYRTRVNGLPCFSWRPHEFEEHGVQGKEIGPLYYKENIDLGMKILWSKGQMWTELADAALIINSYYDFLEGPRRHDWIWFKDGIVFHPEDVKIHQPRYRNIDHAIESIGKEIEVPPDLLRYIIVNSNLSAEQKRSVGFDRPEFTEYKF